MIQQKVFGIGFHKTGTSSLRDALTILGYRVTGPNGVRDPNLEHNVHKIADQLVKEYDAFQDNPWPIIYRELDEKYPGSKFILTVRPTEDWIKSQVRHFGLRNTNMRKWIYGVGCPQGNEEIYIARYEKHNQQVLKYFHNRPKDFLVMNITEGDGWEKLCPFLNQEIPQLNFPHSNKAEAREKALANNQNLLSKIQNKFKIMWKKMSSD